MDSIAVTKPDMAVMKRDRLGLSLFGLLSLAFGDEVRTRSDWQTGLYREVPLDLLEEEEQQPVSGESPAVQLNVDLKVVLETLKKEQQHADQRQRKAAERILERVYLLERQVREHTPVPTQVNIQLGAPQAAAGRAAQAALQAAGTEVRQQAGAAVQAASETMQRRDGRAPRRLTGAQAAAALRQAHRAGGSKAGGTFSQERLGRLAAPLTPVSWSTAAPSGDGWKPQWQEEHPGFARKETQNGGQTGAGGSILLPDQLRRRREQALARAAAQEQGLPQEEMALAEQQFARAIEASVQRTLARRQLGAPQTDGDAPAQTAAQRDTLPAAQTVAQAAVEQIHAAADAAEAERTAAVLPPQNNRPAAPAELVYRAEAEPAAPTADRPQAARPAGDNVTAGRAQTARAEQSIARTAERVKAAEQTAAASHQTAQPADGAKNAPAAAHTAAAERPAAQTEGAKATPAGTQAETAAESGAPTALPASGAQAGQPAAPAELVYRAEAEPAAPTADRPQADRPAGDNAAASRRQAVQTGRVAADTKAAPQTKAGQAASPARPAAQTPVQAKRAQPAWETPAQPQQELIHAPQDAAHTIRPQASQIASVRPMPLHHAAERTAAARPMEPFAYAPAQPAAAHAPAEEGAGLTYLPVQTPAQEQHRTPQPAGQTQMTSDYVRSLPEWAQRFLQQPSETGGAAVQTAQHSAAGRKAAAPPAGQIEWTAPNAAPQGAHIVFRDAVKPKEQQTAPQPVRLSDGELRRAADKVYRMIEDRLRKELRRSGR